ncbi:hypothetical protein AMJ86_01295 [bacterium SM23_57]|jgi:hypothetical protein|nr:MAG: hypothetical protein AMJ86_01295 [bacterium SM23_57]
MSNPTFDILLLIARPAAGKSEIIDHLRKTEVSERIRRYHIGPFEEIDDFPMIWTWFEEDAILSRLGFPRLHTDEEENFIDQHLWHLLIERISLEYDKLVAEEPCFHRQKSVIIEFARGSEHGGYATAFKYLSQNIVKRIAVMYVNVSWEESLRKNRIRFNPDRPYSTLEHALPDDKLEKLYRFVDWEEVSASHPDFLTIQGLKVPYIVFDNEDDVTTIRGEALSERLEVALGKLWDLYNKHQIKVDYD